MSSAVKPAQQLSVSEAIARRRSIKHFVPGQPMAEEEVRWLLEQAMYAPTAFNIQHTRFIQVDDPALRQEIRKVSYDQSQVTDASLLLVLCFDRLAWNKSPQRYWRNAPAEVQAEMVGKITGSYAGQSALQYDEGMRSSSFAAQNLMLAALELDYESCPMDGFDYQAVAKLIHLPEDHDINLMLAIGKPEKPAYPRAGQLALDEVVWRNRFPERD